MGGENQEFTDMDAVAMKDLSDGNRGYAGSLGMPCRERTESAVMSISALDARCE